MSNKVGCYKQVRDSVEQDSNALHRASCVLYSSSFVVVFLYDFFSEAEKLRRKKI